MDSDARAESAKSIKGSHMNYSKQDLAMALVGCEIVERRIRQIRAEQGFYEELAHDKARRERIATETAALVGKKNRMSPAGRRAIARAARKRWAAWHKAQAAPKKRRISAKGLAAIAEAQRKRWAAQKKGKAMGATA
jgi:hypothetical protein